MRDVVDGERDPVDEVDVSDEVDVKKVWSASRDERISGASVFAGGVRAEQAEE